MNGQDDAQVRIGAIIDPTGANAGADQVVKDVDRMEGSVKKTTDATDQLNTAQLGSLRTASHLAHGIQELGEGGAKSIAGLAMEVRIAAEVMESSLGPAAPFIIILSTLLAVTLPQLAKMFDSAGDSAKGIGDKGKEGADTMAQSWTDASKTIGDALEQIRQAQEKVTKQDQADLAAIKEKETLEKGQKKLDEQASIERLRTQYLTDNAKPGLSDADRKLPKEQFEAGKSDITDRSTIHTADLNRETKAREYGALLRNRDDQQAALATNQRMVDDLTKLQQGAQEYISGLGLKRDKDGKITDAEGKDAVEELSKKVTYLEGQYQSAHAGVRAGIMPASWETENKKALDDAKKELADLQLAGKNADLGEAIKKFTDDLPKMQASLADTLAKIPVAITEAVQAAQAADLARQQKINDDKEKAENAAREKAQQEREQADREFEGRNKAAIEAQELILDNPKSTPQQKEAADKEIERLKNAALQRKIDENAPGSAKPLVPGEVAAIQGEQAFNTEKGGNQATKIGDEDAKQKERAIEQQVASYIQQINAVEVGLPAAARKVLEDSVRKIEALDKGNPSQELLDLMNLHIDRQTAINESVKQGINTLRDKIKYSSNNALGN